MASLIDAPRGADLLLSYIFPDGTDLTGYTAAWTVYAAKNGSSLLGITTTANGNGSLLAVNGNILSLTAKAIDIDTLPVNPQDATTPALLWFDLIVTTPMPDVCKLYGGLMRVLPYGAQIAPQGEFIQVALGGQDIAIEIAQSGFDTAVLTTVEGYATAAQTSATAAAASATSAASAASSAAATAASETATEVAAEMQGYVTAASGSATDAATSATNSSTSASAAATSTTAASISATYAASSSAAAASSATAAAGSATGAAGFATSASASATTATTEAGIATTQATAAAGSATTAAATSASMSTLLSTSIVLKPLAPESGFLFGAVDAAQKIAFGLGLDGTFTAFKYAAASIPGSAIASLPAGSVTTASLAASSVNTAAIANGAVTAAKLDTTTVGQYLLQPLAHESGFVWGVVDAVGKMGLGVQGDGTVFAPKFPIPAQSVDFGQLTANLSSYVAKSLAPESGYVWGVLDAKGQMGLGVRTDGSVVGKVSGLLSPGSVSTTYLSSGAVTEAKLDPAVDRMAVPHVTDLIEVLPDKWRAQYGTIAARSSIDGTGWTRFPHTLTRVLRGKNLSGTSLQFRKSAGLAFRGIRDGGSWDPNANTTINSINYIGQLSAAFSTPSTSGRSAGDYYRCIGLTATTFDGQQCLCGDLIVYNGTTWKAQLAPRYGGVQVAPQNGRLEGDFYEVATAGTFDSVAYVVGDKIVHIGFDSLSGSGQPLWYKGQAALGELFYKGEFTPGTTNLSGAVIGDVYQASAAGTDGTSGLTFAVSDYALFDHYSNWGNVPSAAITTVSSNAMIPGLPCVTSANEWEFRRVDKAATVIGVAPTIQHQSSPRRSVDSILLLSDSMFGVPNVQAQLQALVTPRTVNLITRGGGTSRNVMSTYEWYVATQSDPYKGEFTFAWQGQNNQPSTVGDANWCQIIEAALELRNLFGARDRRFCFLSILGTDAMTFDGTRIHVTQHEAMFAGAAQNNVLWQLEQWYATMFPGQWLSPRLALLAAAASSTILDARLPGSGMTEAQTAATYGWVPYSYWSYSVAPIPYPLGSLNLKGYWNSNSMPTGGSSQDCWTIGTSTLGNPGNLIVNVSGTWTVYALDQTHQGANANQGGQQLAAALANYLSTNIL